MSAREANPTETDPEPAFGLGDTVEVVSGRCAGLIGQIREIKWDKNANTYTYQVWWTNSRISYWDWVKEDDLR